MSDRLATSVWVLPPFKVTMRRYDSHSNIYEIITGYNYAGGDTSIQLASGRQAALCRFEAAKEHCIVEVAKIALGLA